MTFTEGERDRILNDSAQSDWGESRPGFCPECHFAWSVHSNAEVSWTRPFGCPPSEHAAQERWGR